MFVVPGLVDDVLVKFTLAVADSLLAFKCSENIRWLAIVAAVESTDSQIVLGEEDT